MPATQLAPTELTLPAVPLAQLGPLYAPDAQAAARRLPADFARLREAMERAQLVPAGAPRVTWVVVRADGGTTFTVAVPVTQLADVPPFPDLAVALATSRPGRYLRFVHHGPYARLGDTYARAGDWLMQHGLLRDPHDWGPCMPVVEEFVGDPATVPPDDLLTHLLVPVPAGAVTWLVCDAPYVTGQIIAIDGGRSLGV